MVSATITAAVSKMGQRLLGPHTRVDSDAQASHLCSYCSSYIKMHVRMVTVGSMYSVCTQCKLAVSDQLSTVAKSVHN
jgi:hypothetical protein